MTSYKAHYADALHDLDLLIQNSCGELTFSIDGFAFVGTSFGAFELANPKEADRARERFCLRKWGGGTVIGKHSLQFPYTYDLQRYHMEAVIPAPVVRASDQRISEGRLLVGAALTPHDPAVRQSIIQCDGERVFCDDTVCTRFQLEVEDRVYEADRKSLFFEPSLLQIIRKMAPDFALKCCFTCQYADYSPYGCDDFGSMLCYRAHKDAYLMVNDKNGYFTYLEGLSYEIRQETGLCREYEPRIHCAGYRGYVK